MPRKAFKKIRTMRGGGEGYLSGIDVNNISAFSPLEIPDIVLWVQADLKNLTTSTIEDYTLNLAPSIANSINQQYKSNPKETVVVGIKSSVPNPQNSLIRLELDTESPLGFPKFITKPGELDVIDMSNLLDPINGTKQIYKMTTKNSVELSSNFSNWIISKNVKIEYIDIIQKIVLSTPYVDTPSTTIVETGPKVVPTAEFSEVVVFSRKLTDSETEQMDGYIAFRKNEQYLLDMNSRFLPTIDSLPFLSDIASQILAIENSLKSELEPFDTAVEKYRQRLPDDPVLQQADPLKQKANVALKQIEDLRKNIIKAGLLSRKKGLESTDSLFESAAELQLYDPPLTADIFKKKIADFSGVLQELETYTTSLAKVDDAVSNAKTQNNEIIQEQQRVSAINVEELEFQSLKKKSQEMYTFLRARSSEVDKVGSTYFDTLKSELTRQTKTMLDAFEYHSNDVQSRWNTILGNFDVIDAQISNNAWLTYIPSLDTSIVSKLNRGGHDISIQYNDSYLNQIQQIYEQVRNQIKEGDFIFVKEECLYHTQTIMKFYSAISDNKIQPLCKKTFFPYFKKTFQVVQKYVKDFDEMYSLLSDAISTLTKTLQWNKENQQKATITKSFPIPIIFSYLQEVGPKFIREVNKHDNSLTEIEYVLTGEDGSLLYSDTDVQFIFPSLENIKRHDQEMFYMKKTPFIDPSGNALAIKYNILEPYQKDASILDTLSSEQVIPKIFKKVEGLYELPRYSANCIYELSTEVAQKPILLPKYALAVGTFYICINVGKIALQIQIPGIPDDMIDILGPSEICIYNYVGPGSNNSTYYGRRFLDTTRISYDMLRDVPRSKLCAKITEFSKYIFMRNETDPVFDKSGFLVEAIPDANQTIYDIDDIYNANPYKITIGKELHVSELTIHPEWSEKMTIEEKFKELYVIVELSTGLPVLCSSKGVPAVSEFGFCKYLMGPMFHIDNKIRTKSALSDPIEIQLNPSESIVQYGLFPPIISFRSVFRSLFVKSMAVGEKTEYIFVNSVGNPIVSPVNTYIIADTSVFQPPYVVLYMDLIKQYTTYIIDGPINSIPLAATTYPYIDTIAKRADSINRTTGEILSYRFKINKEYINHVLAEIETLYEFCKKNPFEETTDTLKLLQQSYTDIEKQQGTYQTYSSKLSLIETKQTISTTDNELKIAIDTLDLKMKEILEKVFSSFKKGNDAIDFFKRVLYSVASIKKEIQNLRDVVSPENQASVSAVQDILQKDKQVYGSPSSSELSDLLQKILELKSKFDTQLAGLEKNTDTMPSALIDLDDWIKRQQSLIKNEHNLRRQIMKFQTTHVAGLYTTRLKNEMAGVSQDVKKNIQRASDFVVYKNRLALWLETPVNYSYRNEILKPATDKPLTGYSISFPIFEELENPLFSRDWESLVGVPNLSDQIRSRISIELILPTKNFINKYSSFLTNNDDTKSIPTIESLEGRTTDELKIILNNSQNTLNEATANAIDMEGVLHPIFENYKKIRSDLRSELQTILQTQAKDIQTSWVKISGAFAAIQTNIQFMQPQFTPEQKEEANLIGKNIDEILNSDAAQQVEKTQQDTKNSAFYSTITYMQMITIMTDRTVLISSLDELSTKLANIQKQYNSLQAATLTNLQTTIQTMRTSLSTSVGAAQNKLSATINTANALETLNTTIQPKVNDVVIKDIGTIPNCIQVINTINSLNAEIQILLGPV